MRNDKGKWKECGRLCHRTDVHGLKDCECNNHIRERQLEEAKSETRFKVPQETVTEDESERILTKKEERILKMAHDISERKREDSRRLTEKWIQQELEQAKKERHRGTRERSDSESSKDDSRKGKRKDRPRINMIRATPKKDVVLTPAPGWQEAVGRPEVRGEDDTTGIGEDGIRDVEVRFVPRRRVEEPDGEAERHDEDPNRVEVIEDDDGIVTGRYAHEAGERIPRPRTEEEQARSEMGYIDYLKWQLSRITTGSRNKCDKKDAKIIEEYKSMTKKPEEPSSNSSSSNTTR